MLTPREREVLLGLLAGLPNKSIAYDLAISPRTVEVHRARIMDKMGARSLSELIRMSLAGGILAPVNFSRIYPPSPDLVRPPIGTGQHDPLPARAMRLAKTKPATRR